MAPRHPLVTQMAQCRQWKQGPAILAGRDPFLRNHIVQTVSSRLKVSAESFEELSAEKLLMELSEQSLFQDRRVVCVSQADQLLKGDQGLKLLETLKSFPMVLSLLMVNDLRAKDPRLEKWRSHCPVVESKTPYTQAAPWERQNQSLTDMARFLIAWAAQELNVSLKADAASALIDRVGDDLGRLVSELEKCALRTQTIDLSVIKTALPGGQQDILFRLVKAILRKRGREAFLNLDRMFAGLGRDREGRPLSRPEQWAPMFFGLVSSDLDLLSRARHLLDAGLTPRAATARLAQHLKRPAWQVEDYVDSATALSFQELDRRATNLARARQNGRRADLKGVLSFYLLTVFHPAGFDF